MGRDGGGGGGEWVGHVGGLVGHVCWWFVEEVVRSGGERRVMGLELMD